MLVAVQTLKALWVRKLWIYPRFQQTIAAALAAHPPSVVELEISLSPRMAKIQQAIQELIVASLKVGPGGTQGGGSGSVPFVSDRR